MQAMTTLRLFLLRPALPHGLPPRNWGIALLAAGRRLTLRFTPPYRPERHYMRGPGPACARRSHSLGFGTR